jgi:hypothetical protein
MTARCALLALLLPTLCYPATCSAQQTAAEEVCGYPTVVDGTVFSMTIARAFSGQVRFKLCAREDPQRNFLLISTQLPDGQGWADRQISLDPVAYANVVELYENALEYDVKYDADGLDGSTWCLETQRGFTYSNACFWMPTDKTEARSLRGLVELGKELWRIAGMNAGELY